MLNTEFADKDMLFGMLLQCLALRGMSKKWAKYSSPYSDLITECRVLIQHEPTSLAIRTYLQTNPIIQETVETLLAHLAMASNAKWQDTPIEVRSIAKSGWCINRWLPTFLIIDGPLGRFLLNQDSPINQILKKEYRTYPTLAQARDAFGHELFKQVRNGFGHWSFSWERQQPEEKIRIIDWETGNTITSITILECDALHLLAFSVIEVLDKEVFKKVNPATNISK